MDPVIVVTTGRAGSSVLAGMLDKLGVFMGDSLVPADRNNPLGHWEDRAFKRLNLGVVQEKIPASRLKDEAAQLGARRSANRDRWGFKVPSTAQVLTHYLDVFPSARYIWARRPRGEVIESMQNAYGWDASQAAQIHDARFQAIDRHLGSGGLRSRTLDIDFAQIQANPDAVILQLKDFLDLSPSTEQSRTARDLVVHENQAGAKVMIAIPNLGWSRVELANHLMMTVSREDRYQLSVQWPSDKPYEKNINKLVHETFLPSDADFLWLVDSDNPPAKIEGRPKDPVTGIRYNPLDLVQLNRDIISCPTPQPREGDVFWVIMDDAPEQTGVQWEAVRQVPPEKRRSLQKIDATGSGCILIARRVLEDPDMKAPFVQNWNEQGIPELTGDFTFCKRARKAGYSVWAHWDYRCAHFKETDVTDRFRIGAKAHKRGIEKGRQMSAAPKTMDQAQAQ